MPERAWRPQREGYRGFSLLELLLAVTIFALAIGGGFAAYRAFAGKRASQLSQRLALQMEARRALVNLFGVVQEGIELLKPDPGATQPFLVLRDKVNNVLVVFLKRDVAASEREKKDIFRLYSVLHDTVANTNSALHEILANIERLNFTAHGYTSVLVTCTLCDGASAFSFVNLIRLKNAQSEEGI